MSHAGSIPANGDAGSKTDDGGRVTVGSSQTSAQNVVAPVDIPTIPRKWKWIGIREVKKELATFALLLNADHFPVLPPLLYFTRRQTDVLRREGLGWLEAERIDCRHLVLIQLPNSLTHSLPPLLNLLAHQSIFP